MPLSTDVEPGDSGHADLHNEERGAINDHEADMTIHTSGRELGYAEVTSYAATAMGTSPADAVGLTVDVVVGTRPIRIDAFMPVTGVNTGGGVGLSILEDGVAIVYGFTPIFGAAASTGSVRATVRRQPSPGEHTYKVQMQTYTAAAGAYTSHATYPALLQVTEV